MPTNQLRRVIQNLREATLPHEEAGLTDGQLLDSYVRNREETALAALVRRHGPMVWGVCRRVLRSHHDAEDAFQATFLVLVRKAPSVVPREKVANWLYGVARQTALYTRATAAKRAAREKQVTAMPEPALEQQELWHDLRPLLDLELGRLPDKYREVIVVCDLEGKTRKEAARHFNLPEGTVATRLATARAMLAKRLARHCLPVSSAALAVVLAQQAAASVPTALAAATIKAASLFAAGTAAAWDAISVNAVALAEGVLKTMLLTKLKFATVVLVIAVLATGAAALTQQVLGGRVSDQPIQTSEVPATKPVDPPAKETQVLLEKQPDQQDAEKKETALLPTVVSGIVKAVDARTSTLTVSHREGDTTFSVAKDAEIDIDGKRGELAVLPAGANVNLRQFVDAKTTRSVQAEGRWFWGVVKAVDAVNNTVTFGDKAQDGAAGNSFTLAKDTFITIDGKPGKLAGIPTGASVNLNLYVDQQTVRSLSAEGEPISGVVKAVNSEKNAITINDTTYAVARDAYIAIDLKPGTLAGVPVGANVTVNLQVDQKTVLRISAGGSSVFGTVKYVDTAKNTITVTGHANDRTFNVPADTVIVIDGNPAKLSDIPTGAGLHALNLRVDQQTAHSMNVIGPGYHHIPVKALDAQGNTITIDDSAPAPVAGKTLRVAPNSNIEIDGKPGKLAGVPPGAFVNLGLSVDGQTVFHLQAEGPNLGGCGGSKVTAVDAEKCTITFDDKGSADVAGKTFIVLKDASIGIDGKRGRLAELPMGSFVNLTLTVDRQAVRSIGAQGPAVSGVVKAVDAEKKTITVDDRTFLVAQDVTIAISDRPGRLALAELHSGANVSLRLRVDQQTVIGIQVKAP